MTGCVGDNGVAFVRQYLMLNNIYRPALIGLDTFHKRYSPDAYAEAFSHPHQFRQLMNLICSWLFFEIKGLQQVYILVAIIGSKHDLILMFCTFTEPV